MPPCSPLALVRDLIAPPRCAVCFAACGAREPLCLACRAGLAGARAGAATIAGIGPTTWAAPYDGTARALVAALKFRAALGLAAVAAASIAATLESDSAAVTVVPVPAASLRRRLRGFDPTELIAIELARIAALGVAMPLVRLDGRRQVGRDRRERLARPPRVRLRGRAPRRVLLVDDVLTTGASLRSCAAALRAAGCAELGAAVFARAL